MPEVRDLGAALGLLTRLPVPNFLIPKGEIRNGAWAFPLIGALIGLIAAGVQVGALTLGAPTGLAAALALGAMLLLTGALHEDGLADSADGLGGGRTRARILEIMRDSHIGTFGIAALSVALLARWSAMDALTSPILALPLAGALSRMPMVLVMTAMPHARADGVAVAVGRAGRRDALIALVTALLLAGVVAGWTGLLAIAAALIAIIPITFWASRLLGGQTGDILGACQQVAEIAVLLVLVIRL